MPRPAGAPKSHATLFVSLAAAAAVIVLVVLLATRGSDTTTPTGSTSSGSAAPAAGSADAQVAVAETRPEPAQPAAPDAPKSRMERIAAGDFAPDPKPGGTPKQPRPSTTTPALPKIAPTSASPPPPVAASDSPSCEQSCKAAARCGFPSATCIEDCANDPAGKPCLDRAVKNCNSFARCLFGAICNGAEPSGTGTCADAAVCQGDCPDGDIICGCRCAAQMAPAHSLTLLRLDLCVAKCGNDEACAERTCRGLVTACARPTAAP
jgi:hypothetical protein